jgi:Mce-associated membrane protein
MADNADAADTAELVDESTCLAETSALDVDVVDDVEGVAEDIEPPEPPEPAAPRPHGLRLALAMGLLIVTALGGLVGWLGFRADQSHEREQQRGMFLAAARQGALNLTTISYTEVDADIKRILDSATGTFHDDFEKRSQPFVEVVKRAQSKSQGTITEAGLESMQADNAHALVAVTVTTSNAGAAQQEPRSWRMRIDVEKVGDMAKLSNVEFVP